VHSTDPALIPWFYGRVEPWHPLQHVYYFLFFAVCKVKATIPVIGSGGLYGCQTFRIPHCLDNRLTDGSEVLSPTHRPRSIPQKHYFSSPSTHLRQRLSNPQGLVRLETLGTLKQINDLIRIRTRGLPACSTVPQPLRTRPSLRLLFSDEKHTAS
jgi:hypothetical protein